MQPPSYDGPVSRYVNRRFSRPLASLLARTPVTPNQVSVFSVLVAALGAALLLINQTLLAAVAIQASSIIDGVDGDLARRKGMSSRFGAIFDAILDRYADAVIILGMAIWAEQHEDRPAPLLVAFAALMGALLVSYSRARTEASAGLRLSDQFLGIMSRDVRMLVLALGAAFHQMYWTLAAVAILSHVTVAWRLLLLRRKLPMRNTDGDV
jgi:phosphatidylglycerophosphate synthase